MRQIAKALAAISVSASLSTPVLAADFETLGEALENEEIISVEELEEGGELIISRVPASAEVERNLMVKAMLDARSLEQQAALKSPDPLTEVEVYVDRVINLGKKIWKVIADNAPVVNVKYDYANAIPEGLKSSSRLSGFSDLNYDTWRIRSKNGFGVEVINVVYSVVHQHGGTYNGVGKYLESVSVVPQNVDVSWGFNVSFEVRQVSTTNVGTSEAPVASMVLETLYHSKTVFRDRQMRQVFHIRGDRAEVLTVE